jgi:hypothetical protein
MKKWTKMTVAVGVLMGTVVLATWVGRQPHLTCHKVIFGASAQWQSGTTKSDWYPNFEGGCLESPALLAPFLNDGRSELRDYR